MTEMSKHEMFELLDELLVKNWNSDTAIANPIEKGDKQFLSYRGTMLEMMIEKKELASWIEYFQNKLGA